MTVGVQLTETTIPGPGTSQVTPGSGYLVVGQTLRGNPAQPVQVTSLGQFVATFGGEVTYGGVYNDLAAFFGEGGTYAWVSRIVGTGATAGDLVLNDQGATPQPTLKLTAGAPNIDPVTGNNLGNVADPGSWSTGITVQVVASVLTNQYKILVSYAGSLVETWGPFPDVPTAVTKINSSSAYLQATNMNSTNAAPSSNPAVLAATALSAGNDQRSTITAQMEAAQYSLFDPIAGGEWAGCPEYDASLVAATLQTWAASVNCDLGLHSVEGTNDSTVAADAANFRGTTGSQNSGYFWPWVQIPNGSGGTVVVPPDGAVAGLRSRTIAAVGGPWQPPAGNWGVFRYVVGLDPASGTVTDAIGDSLNSEHVNVLRPKAGLRLYGWRSLSTDLVNWELLNQSDVLNNIATELGAVEDQFAFSMIDSLGQLGKLMQNAALEVLRPYVTAGALWPGPLGADGTPSDPGYTLDTGSDVNTPQTIAANSYGIAVYVRPAGAAELIPVRLVKAAIGNAF